MRGLDCTFVNTFLQCRQDATFIVALASHYDFNEGDNIDRDTDHPLEQAHMQGAGRLSRLGDHRAEGRRRTAGGVFRQAGVALVPVRSQRDHSEFGRRREVVGAGDHQQHAARRPRHGPFSDAVGYRHHELVHRGRLAGPRTLSRAHGRPDDLRLGAPLQEDRPTRPSTGGTGAGRAAARMEGCTWEPAVASIASSPHGPTELQDGSLLYVGTGKPGNGELVSVRSTDDGQSWQTIGSIPVPDEHKEQMPYAEPHAIETDDGRIVSLWRHIPRNRHDAAFMQQSESDDGGRTWTVAHPTPMWGYPPHLIKLHDGSILATYGIRRSPFGQRACLSYDGGRTWDIDNEIILRDDAPNGDLGYPSTVELGPGELLSIYYQIDVIGEKTCFIATRWSLG